MLDNQTNARVQLLTRSSVYTDLRALIDDIRIVALEEALRADTQVAMFRAQGAVNALDQLINSLEHLRTMETIDDTPQDTVVGIPVV